MNLRPCTIREAKEYVRRVHRHHEAPVGGLFAVAVEHEGVLVGVAIVGRPVARLLQDGYTAEVTRVATDGTANACSILYAAAWRACRALGYRRLVTYTLQIEPGISLRGAGWRLVGAVHEQTWNRPSRQRKDVALGDKFRWEAA